MMIEAKIFEYPKPNTNIKELIHIKRIKSEIKPRQ